MKTQLELSSVGERPLPTNWTCSIMLVQQQVAEFVGDREPLPHRSMVFVDTNDGLIALPI